MGSPAFARWTSAGLVAAVLVGGYVLGRLSAPDAKPAPAAARAEKKSPTAEKGAAKSANAQVEAKVAKSEPAEPTGAGDEAKTERGKGHTYDGEEYERVKQLAELDEIDRWTLKLRKKQPIHFLGVEMRQIPTDNWLMSELVWKLDPDVVIETGTLHGGSALFYAALLEQSGSRAKVLTVDINPEQLDPAAVGHKLWKKRVTFIEGSSTAPEVIGKIRRRVGEKKSALVTLDTLHAPDHVREELELYSQFVGVGGYMILQDTYYEGLMEVLDGFLAEHPNWERDEELDERFLFTKYRGGFLRRVK